MHVCLTLRGKRCGPEDSRTIDCMALSSCYSWGVVSHNNCSVSDTKSAYMYIFFPNFHHTEAQL